MRQAGPHPNPPPVGEGILFSHFSILHTLTPALSHKWERESFSFAQ